ncbi:MAG: cellulose biosynthesis cyclic di-GMP-binding regulatory protein BcsB [Microbacteriaceae bacterium]|jgi:hypothetical protein|nr:cellulose biosynthesis cyclic di-GMP-binding regulatory protein BcsB [Microbacteriaceae bacterium]MCI1207224.1 cellulose biosynthesis cyclic di-GMP-binding regulatory protein BcsB [Microbacteriaceae bacterium]
MNLPTPAVRPRPATTALAVLCLLLLVGSFTPVSTAQAAATQTISLPDSSVSAGIDAGAATTDLTLPSGTSATTLDARLTLETADSGATVEVSVTGTGATQTQRLDAGQTEADIHLANLPAALTKQGAAGGTLHLSVRLDSASVSQDNACAPLPTANTATVDHIRVGLSGEGTLPSTVRDFVRGPAQSIYILASRTKNTAVQQGALQAATAAAKIWTGQSTRIRIVSTLPAGLTPSYPGAIRVIRIIRGTHSTQRVTANSGIPQITLTGTGSQLAAAARGLAGAAARLASDASTTDLQSTTQRPGVSRTLRSLGVGTVQLSGFGTTQAYVGLSQSSFGGPVSEFRIHLQGAHTAIPSEVAARANVLWNGNLIASYPLGSSSTFSKTIRVPSSRITSQNSLTVVLNATTTGKTACAGALRGLDLRFDLDTAASRVDATRGQSLRTGFSRFPQVLGNRLAVAIDHGTSASASLELAGAVLTSLQRAAGRAASPIGVSVLSVSKALSSHGSVFVVGATASTANALRAPLRLARFRTITATHLTSGVGTDQPYMSLQALERGGRDILLSGGWAPAGQSNALPGLSRALATRVLGVRYGWSAWSDNLLVLGPDHRAVNLGATLVSPQPAATNPYRRYAWWAVAAGVLLVAVFLLGWSRRRRLRRKRAKQYAQREALEPRGVHARRAEETGSETEPPEAPAPGTPPDE